MSSFSSTIMIHRDDWQTGKNTLRRASRTSPLFRFYYPPLHPQPRPRPLVAQSRVAGWGNCQADLADGPGSSKRNCRCNRAKGPRREETKRTGSPRSPRRALSHWRDTTGTLVGPVIRSERGGPMTPVSIVNWFSAAYQAIGLEGCSSHSGRRTFITRAARLVHHAGGSMRDVQLLAGHRSIQTTQRYIDGDTDAQRKLVSMI